MTSDETATDFDDGSLHVDFAQREVIINGKFVDLSPHHYLVLSTLIRHQGQPVSVTELTSVLWGDDPPDYFSVSLRGYIQRLRDLLGRSAIETAWDGYLYQSQPH